MATYRLGTIFLASALAMALTIPVNANEKFNFNIRTINNQQGTEKDGKLEVDTQKRVVGIKSGFGDIWISFENIAAAELERRGERNYLVITQQLKDGQVEHFLVIKNAKDLTKNLNRFQQAVGIAVKGF